MDIAYVNQKPILVSIDEASNCILAYDLKGSKSHNSLILSQTKLIAAYRSFGHSIRTIFSDGEPNLLSTEVFLNTNGIQLHHSLPGRHCATVERVIRTIKDRARSVLSTLSYTLPPACRIALFLDAASCCNLIPTEATGGRSPREIFTGVKLDASIHLRASFGEYVLVKTPWTSAKPPDTVKRAEGALVVGRDLKSRGGIKAFLLASNQILLRDSFTPAVLTDAIIAQINSFSTNSPLLPASDAAESSEEEADDVSNAIEQTLLPSPGVQSSLDAKSQSSTSGDVLSVPSASTDRGANSRYPLRTSRTTWKDRVFNLTYKQAYNLYGERASESVIAEVAQMVQFEVWDLCKRQHLSLAQIKRIIPCSLFLKEKLFPDGTFDKLKSRLVAGGHKQDISLYDNVSSPTVNLITVYVILVTAAYEGHQICAIDIKGAYLNAKLKSVDVHMRIPPYLAMLFASVYKDLQKRDISEFIDTDGSIVVKLKKAL